MEIHCCGVCPAEDHAYVLAFLTLDFGRGSAAAIIGGLIILVVGVVLYRVTDRIVRS